MGIFSLAGNTLDRVGTTFGAKERGWSERLANGPTINTGVTSQSKKAGYVPYTPSNFSPNVPYNIYSSPSGQQDPNNKNGSVLGTTTAGGGNSGNNSQPTTPTFNLKDPNANPGSGYFWDAADGWKPENNGGGEAPDLYAEINGAFDEVLGGLGGQQSDMEGRIRSAADTQKTGINEQLGYGVENLNTQREGVRSNQANTLADLAQTLRDQARNVNMYMGARGVSGSANDAASFALQKLFGKERAGVQRQGQDQLFQIDTAEINLKAKASSMINDVDTWTNTQMTDIAQQFNDLRNNIGTMKGSMRAQAVESLWNRYQQVQSTKEQYMMNIQQAAQDRLAQLNNLKLELSDSANFNPSDIVYDEYGFDPSQSNAIDDADMFNPLALAKRKSQGQV